MRLIGLNGRKEAGKDTAFDIIRQVLRERNEVAIRRAFADPLKISGMRALGFHKVYDGVEGLMLTVANVIKESGVIKVEWDDVSPSGQLIPRRHQITGRELWQFYGTEAHRAEDLGHSFSTNFWVDNVLPCPVSHTPGMDSVDHRVQNERTLREYYPEADVLVVTDVRFPNEAQRVLNLGGEVWEIDADQRIGAPRDDHPSEQPLPIELVTRKIDNNGTVEDLEKGVREALA